jgi:hypothetical protein
MGSSKTRGIHDKASSTDFRDSVFILDIRTLINSKL